MILSCERRRVLNRIAQGDRRSDLGWNALLENPVKVIMVPGDHQTMLTAPHGQTLAEQSERAMEI